MTTLNAPLIFFWLLTYECNLRCPHCYANAGKPSLLELTTDESKNLIDQLASMGVFRIAFSGGEPLLRNDLLELCEYARENKIKTSITTNATQLNENLAKRLYDTGVDTIQVNIEGAEEKTHNMVRHDTFSETLSGITMLKKVGFNVLIGTVVTRSNLEEIPRIYEMAKSLEAYSYRLLRLIPTGRGRGQTDKTLTRSDYNRFIHLYKSFTSENEKTQLIIGCYWCFAQVLNNLEVPSRACGGGVNICSMTPDGYIIPCSLFSDPALVSSLPADNLRNKEFKEIWTHSEILNTMRSMPKLLQGKCSLCLHKEICVGGCRAETFSLTGSLYASHPVCWYDPNIPRKAVCPVKRKAFVK